MNNKQNLGKLGEEIATNYLISHNYKIIDRNYKCKYGEIDIIASTNNLILFVEVKTRQNTNYGYPIESITKIKQKHIYNTATFYLLNNKISNTYQIRIDAIEIYVHWPDIKINHIKGILTN